MTQQADIECRCARRISRQNSRWRRCDLPAALRGAGDNITLAEQERKYPRLRRPHRQPPRRGQVDGARLAPWLQHHGSNGIAGNGIRGRAQQGEGVGRLNQNDSLRIMAEFGQPEAIEPAVVTRPILAQPDKRTGAVAAQRQQQGKASGSGRITLSRRVEFVQRRYRQPAAQPLIEPLHAERQARPGQRF